MPGRGHRVMKGGYKGPPPASSASAPATTNTAQDTTTADNVAAASASSTFHGNDAKGGESKGEHKTKEHGHRKGSGGDGNGSRKPPLTHFLCIPLVTGQSRPQLEASMKAFRRDVLGEGEQEDDGSAASSPTPFPPAALRPVGTLHLTLGVMSLTDSAAVERALCLLRSLDLSSLLSQAQPPSSPPSQSQPPSASQPPLTISLRSVHPMHRPASTSILYACPHDVTDRLYPFACALRSLFADSGLLVPDDRPLLLHATLVNTAYARGRWGRSVTRASGKGGDKAKGKWSKNGRFDARELMARYEDFAWAEQVLVQGVAVCEMGARELGEGRGVGYREAGWVGFAAGQAAGGVGG